MKRGLILTGVFAGAILLLTVFVVMRQHSAQPGRQFQVKDPEKIRRIVFRRDTVSLQLREKGGEWLINGKWKVRPRALKTLLRVLGEMEVKSPLSGDLLRKVLNDTSGIRTEVTVYGRLLPEKRFEVIRNPRIPGGNIMRMFGKKEWYILQVPGEDIDPAALFVTDPRYWRDLSLFHYLPGEVTGVEIRYGHQKKRGFYAGTDTLTGKVIFRPFDTALAGLPVDSGKVKRFLTYFQDLSADAWEGAPEQGQRETTQRGEPLYEVKVEAAGRKDFRMEIFPLYRRDSLGREQVDPDVARARVEPPGEMILIKYYRIDPFLLKNDDFILRGK